MPRYELALRGGSEGDRFTVSAEGIVIGRAPDVDVVLAGPLVSRRHARVWLEGDALWVEDLGSRNGITINENRVERDELHAGDALTVGDSTFDVLKHISVSSGRTVIPFDVGSTLCENIVQKDAKRFPILHRATQLLGTVFDLDQLLKEILELIFDAFPVRRGFILILDPDSQEPQVRAMLSSEGEAQGPPFSRTLVDRVVLQREAVLTMDAMADARFDGAQSIVGHAIRAAMCVPLCGRQAILGAIYVDSGRSDVAFGEDDLQLLTALGRVVGVAVENAQLYKENIERERLAALGEAMAGVGHCVKNILTALRGGGILIDRAFERSELDHMERNWPFVRRALERIDMLVINMLTFARDPQPSRTLTDINALVDEAIAMVHPRADKLKVTIEHVPCECEKAWLDERQVYRVLLNLLTNALDACESKGGAVVVTNHCDEKGCTIEVHDNGPGIAPEIIPKLSQAFVTTKGSAGIGLGLASCYKIVRAHGGDITVKSTPDQGATFTVFLPSETLATRS